MTREVIQHDDGTWGIYAQGFLVYSAPDFDDAMDTAREFDEQWEDGEIVEWESEPGRH